MEADRAWDDLGPDLEQSLRVILGHFEAEVGTIHTLEADGLLHLRAHTAGIPESVLAATRVIPIGKGMAGLAVERRAPVNVCNIQQDKSGDVRPGAQATGAKGSLCVPMMAADRAVGALGIACVRERNFSEAEVRALLEAGRALAQSVLAKPKQ
jgi:L-methionine (R)-S-oxide reductase